MDVKTDHRGSKWTSTWLRGADGAWQRGTIEVMERPTGQLGLGLADV